MNTLSVTSTTSAFILDNPTQGEGQIDPTPFTQILNRNQVNLIYFRTQK